MIYIATVTRLWRRPNNREGTWASFVDKNKEHVLRKATEAKRKWEAAGHGPYEILVGTLTEQLQPPQFTPGHLTPIDPVLAGPWAGSGECRPEEWHPYGWDGWSGK